MSAGRTYWWAKDAAWLRRELVVELGEEFGPAGPLVLDALNGAAKLENDGGRVRSGFRALARDCFLDDPQLARRIVEHAGAIGALDDLELDEDGRRFVARISGWAADQNKGRAAQRQADKRAADQADEPEPPVTEGDESRSVTHGHVPVGTGQDSTGQKEREGARDRGAEEQLHPLLPTILDRFYALDGYLTDAGGVVGALNAHPWATDDEIRAVVEHVALWCTDTADPARSPSTAGLLRQELQKRSRARIAPSPPLRAVGGARATAPDRAAEFRREAAAGRAQEARA